MSNKIICKMINGAEVYYVGETSHTATHLADTPQLLPLLVDFLSLQSFHDDKLFLEHDAGVTIGHTDLVETSNEDEIVYAQRRNRDNFTRFVKNKQAPLTSFFTVVLYKDEDNNYELASTWVGRLCPPFPDDINATPDSRQFWENHALVFGNQALQEDTLTTKQPW